MEIGETRISLPVASCAVLSDRLIQEIGDEYKTISISVPYKNSDNSNEVVIRGPKMWLEKVRDRLLQLAMEQVYKLSSVLKS